jgi:uncharacterized protein YjbJ (UPF0337 family)
MDKDRVKGSGKFVKGRIKEAVGRAIDDTELESEGQGRQDRGQGSSSKAVGGLKDAFRGE